MTREVRATGGGPASVATSARAVGRPRDPDVDVRIRQATLAILIDDGYAAVTMESVARAAGVAHTTVYRRWPSKAHLVHEVLFPATDAFAVDPDSSLEQALGALIGAMTESFARPESRAAMPGLLADYRTDQVLFDGLFKRFEPGLTALLDALLLEAASHGDARDGVSALTLLDTILGFALVGAFLRVDADPADRAAELLDLVLLGLRPAATRPPTPKRSRPEPKTRGKTR